MPLSAASLLANRLQRRINLNFIDAGTGSFSGFIPQSGSYKNFGAQKCPHSFQCMRSRAFRKIADRTGIDNIKQSAHPCASPTGCSAMLNCSRQMSRPVFRGFIVPPQWTMGLLGHKKSPDPFQVTKSRGF